ncbi:MAG: hypothetical protein ABSA49_07450 [Rhizomicrobium sp.]
MTRRLFIHTGPPKTGTSALQYVLRDHDGSVVQYPKAGQWNDGSHHNLVLNFFEDYVQPQVVREDIDKLFAAIAADARQSKVPLAISSEMLSGRGGTGDFIQALLSRLGEEFEVEIIFVVREHFERTASLYGQRVRSSSVLEKGSPDEYLTRRASVLCYTPSLQRFLETKFPIRLFSYDPGHDLVPRLLRHMGFPDDKIAAPPTRNPSMSIKRLIATLMANRHAPIRQDRRKLVRALASLSQSFAPAKFIFGQEAALAADKLFSLDRAFLRKRFGFDLAAPDLAGRENEFWLNKEEYAEICASVAGLGNAGAQLREHLRAFVRD